MTVQILMNKNYPRQFYRDLYQYFKGSIYARNQFDTFHNINIQNSGPVYKRETKYTPQINDLLTYLYQYGYDFPGPLIIQLIIDKDPNTDITFRQYENEVDQIFLRRHPEITRFFTNLDYNDQ